MMNGTCTPHAVATMREQPVAAEHAAAVAPAATGAPVAGPAPLLAPTALFPVPSAGNLVVTFESGRPASDDSRTAAAADPVPLGPAGPDLGGTVGGIVAVPDEGEATPDGLE